MTKNPSSCCLCIDLQTGSIILALIQIASSGCQLIGGLHGFNGSDIPLPSYIYSIFSLIFGLYGLHGIYEKNPRAVRYFANFMLFKLIAGGALLSVFYFGSYLVYKADCRNFESNISEICSKVQPVILGLVALVTVLYAIKVHFYKSVKAYADLLEDQSSGVVEYVPVLTSIDSKA